MLWSVLSSVLLVSSGSRSLPGVGSLIGTSGSRTGGVGVGLRDSISPRFSSVSPPDVREEPFFLARPTDFLLPPCFFFFSFLGGIFILGPSSLWPTSSHQPTGYMSTLS